MSAKLESRPNDGAPTPVHFKRFGSSGVHGLTSTLARCGRLDGAVGEPCGHTHPPTLHALSGTVASWLRRIERRSAARDAILTAAQRCAARGYQRAAPILDQPPPMPSSLALRRWQWLFAVTSAMVTIGAIAERGLQQLVADTIPRLMVGAGLAILLVAGAQLAGRLARAATALLLNVVAVMVVAACAGTGIGLGMLLPSPLDEAAWPLRSAGVAAALTSIAVSVATGLLGVRVPGAHALARRRERALRAYLWLGGRRQAGWRKATANAHNCLARGAALAARYYRENLNARRNSLTPAVRSLASSPPPLPPLPDWFVHPPILDPACLVDQLEHTSPGPATTRS